MNYKYTPKAYKLVKYLQDHPKARERSNKDKAIVALLAREYGWLMRMLTENPQARDSVVRFVEDVLYYDRRWRKILEQEPQLRGSDYGDKDILEQKAMLELGYEVGANDKLPTS